MTIPIYQIDAFSGKLFCGNPAAVCPLERWLDDAVMQHIAAENNLSETAFFVRNGYIFEIRWFTPTTEVELCGHATLAAAHVIYSHLNYREEKINFVSRSGELVISKKGNLLSLDFPARMPKNIDIPLKLELGLNAKPLETLCWNDYFLAVFEKEEDIRNISPNFEILTTMKEYHGFIVTAPGINCDFVSRFFAPIIAINEDPVTGSAHTVLIPYWYNKLQKQKLHALQLSNRCGELFCEFHNERVKIAGKAVTYMVGELFI